MKIIMPIILITIMIVITGCSDKNTGDCNGVKYLINESHCVKNCQDDCYGNTICGRNSEGCYPNHCYGFIFNGQMMGNGCADDTLLCNHGSYYCTSSVHTYVQDKIDAENAKIAEATAKAESDRVAACWANGTFYNYTLDIIYDYDLSCDQLSYINDHLIDKTRQVDGGYINGHYSGFVSHGSVEGHFYQYVTEGVLATGTLVKNINYEVDCNNQTRDKNIDYYSESDFVMYYVNHCIKT